MASLFDMLTSQAMASYYERLAVNREPYIGEALFPAQRKPGLRLEWIKGYEGLPVQLNPSAFDAKPLLRDRGGVSQESLKMPFFREAMRLDETDRQMLLEFLNNNNNSAFARQLINRLFDDTNNLVAGALIDAEIMRMGILTTGAFTISSRTNSGQDVSYDYNYDKNNTWKGKNTAALVDTEKWSDHVNSNPVQDIIDQRRVAAARGITLTRGIMGYGTWLDIMANQKIRLAINPLAQAAANVILTDEQILSYLRTMTRMSFEIVDKTYLDVNHETKYFYPDSGHMTLLPANTLGSTYFGTTPEEADLQSGNTLADVSVVETGIAIATEKIALPVNLINWVSMIALPSFENMDQVFNISY